MKLSELVFGKIEKDGEFDWLGLTAEEYTGKKVLTFLNDEKYYKEIENNKSVTCIITTKEVLEKIKGNKYGIILSENPRKDFFELHNKLVKENFYFSKNENKISEKAIISEKATIGEYNIIIEEDVIIESNVTIYENVTIKKGSIIRSGTRIGGNGFEFSRFGEEVLSIEFAGDVFIDENVEIQNNTCIDRGVFDRTYLGKNVKVDNLVHIAHDVKIGANTLVVACTLIGGRTKIGNNSYLGPNCTVKNGLILGENSKVSMGAVVTKDVKDNEVVTGNFAIPHKQFIENLKKM
ncbi:UDP-3-O-(3-hydroxymyristoyl)glucosamine N-acyltransferase [Fusobacterium polymorphum]|uniref:UDP-3-O-(3-hydroxymyristoyl)glucosamine N-acyltransferase n=1 Tax=Fusobacterium nucleatum subsp. polymorphum TaxID=76857 RepID=UPI002B4BB8DC|nr:UDP-3-O-(3-hydroxymyristoyl)glucosamine N-acyltransferase [Fusobacterium polymorphum]WRL69999.1 UDP-3-O-(3-hydroxymyristoyl)glucosamine N-acyltransferase [Fusobacterium polymorphum]